MQSHINEQHSELPPVEQLPPLPRHAPPEELPLEPPLDDPPTTHEQPPLHSPPMPAPFVHVVPGAAHPMSLHTPAPPSHTIMPMKQLSTQGIPCPGQPPPLLLPLDPPDPPEELPLAHVHELQLQLEVHVSIPLHVPVLHDVIVPGLHTPLPVQAPHCPVELHVWLPQLPQDLIDPAKHTPAQAVPTQVVFELAQYCVVCQSPFESQVSRLSGPEHCTWPGAQLPVHTPLTQAMLVHAWVAPHCPVLESHVCTPLPTQRVWPGAHMPVHAPAMHVWSVHATGVPHMPPLQVCTALPEHCVCEPVQTPVHWPFVQLSPAGQAVSIQWPVPSHVCTPVPLASQLTAFGSHMPHWPAEHTDPSQGTAPPQVPLDSQVSTPPSPAHCVLCGAHVPVHTAAPASPISHAIPWQAPPTGVHWPLVQSSGC